MKKLKNLFEGIIEISQDVEISSVHIDSREVAPGGMFFALKGTAFDGHDFINDAIARGARVIVCEKKQKEIEGVVYVIAPSVKDIAGIVISRFFDNPSQLLKIIGVTGTNGKTSVATMTYQALSCLGQRAGLLSTVVNKIGDEEFESTHTTGDVVQVHKNLKSMVDAGCSYCCMEVSSHALEQGRVVGVDFDIAVFTNLTQDHLDYHKTMNEYARTKKILFDTLPSTSCAIINADDEYGAFMIKDCLATIIKYGIKKDLEFSFNIIENSFKGLKIDFDNFSEVRFPVVGTFNAYNASSVVAALDYLDLIDSSNIQEVAAFMTGAVGRMQMVWNTNACGIVDYAHTPDALEKVLKTLNDLKSPESKIITVFGAGGDRDPSKRSLMGYQASSLSDVVIITNDNPRTENPEKILQDIVAGIKPETNYHTISDRRTAIRKAVSLASPKDIVLVAGKGHETYQIIGTTKHVFNDVEELVQAFEEKFNSENMK